jgi:DNA-binding GntR family transcriptional regulator
VAEHATYRRIADELRQQIETGVLAAGAMAPSEAALTAQYEVSRGTVRAALSLLVDGGLIEVVPGQGRRVTGVSPGQEPAATAYERIAAAIRDRMDAGEFRPNDQLPSESALMAEFGASRNTVRRAYRHLVESGAVVIRHGAGAFPAPR